MTKVTNRKLALIGACGAAAGIVCLMSLFFDDIVRAVSGTRTPSSAPIHAGADRGADVSTALATQMGGKSELAGVKPEAEFLEFAAKVNLDLLSSDRAIDEGLWKVKYGTPRRFAVLEWHDGFCDLLDDPAYAAHWHKIARIIAFISKKDDSAKKIVEYVKRKDDWTKLTPRETENRMSEKVGVLRMLGLFGSDWTDDILRQAMTREGARAFAGQWLEATPASFASERAIFLLQGSAAMGLVYSQKPENLERVRQAYQEEHALCLKRQASTKLHSQLVTAMAYQDVISELGMDGFWNLYGSNSLVQKTLEATRKYTYRPPR
ncbi:MAG: hypothetical protein NT031_11855 [Planctomycetota bacterium]|nr:hypothetical protein [Planctomycetota bacterium]